MIFEWDESKNKACLDKRGFNFKFAAEVFFDPDRIIESDNRRGYGEDRYRIMGRIKGRLYVVVYTPRINTLRIISARKANKREVLDYENRTSQD